jgi:hypothetical protein
MNALGSGTKCHHSLSGSLGYARHGAAPAAMHCGNDSGSDVGHEQRHAVGSVDANHLPGAIAHQSVNVGIYRFLAGKRHASCVGLSRHEYLPVSHTEVCGKPCAVSCHLRGIGAGIIANVEADRGGQGLNVWDKFCE